MKNTKIRSWGILALLLLGLATCSSPNNVPSGQVVISDFENSTDGWSGDFADLFMYMMKKISGLDVTQPYEVAFDIDLASNYATNSVGIGGSPGASVFLKAGVSSEEPLKVLKGNYYEVTIDKGNQAQEGEEMLVLGHVGAGQDVNYYRVIRRDNLQNPIEVKPDAEGNLWLCVGTDSGFEGKTILYYDKIRALIRPVEAS